MSPVIQPGSVIEGKYRVLRHIGEGGMGTVYEGVNDRIDRRVAIKVLHPEVAASPEFAQRFEREARAAARIGSPYICDVLDSGEFPSGERFIVMEFLEGESLEDRIARGQMSAPELAPIAFEILEGLRTMHQAGVIHRDLKPANVFLVRRAGRGRGEIVKILDFGVAKLLPRAGENANMTSTGVMIGTPLYMSPEQARGSREVDARTDIYAASVMFYRALTGTMPHAAANLHELLFKIVLEEPASIRVLTPDVDAEFSDIVMCGLARDVDQRLASARVYQEAIAAWGHRHGHPSLRFDVGESAPPPGLSGTGPRPPNTPRMPPAAPSAAGTGPSPMPAPTTPAVAKTQVHDASGPVLPNPPTPSARQLQNGGTPIVWSEDAPRAVQDAVNALEGKHGSAPGQRTQTAAMLPVMSPAAMSSPPSPMLTPAPMMPPPKPRGLALGLVGAAVVLLAVAFGVSRLVSLSPTPAASKSIATAPPPPDPTPPPDLRPPPMPSATAEIPPPPSATADPPASAAPSVATTEPPRPQPPRPQPPRPQLTSTPTPSAVASVAKSATPPPAPTPTTSARKFRTTLD